MWVTEQLLVPSEREKIQRNKRWQNFYFGVIKMVPSKYQGNWCLFVCMHIFKFVVYTVLMLCVELWVWPHSANHCSRSMTVPFFPAAFGYEPSPTEGRKGVFTGVEGWKSTRVLLFSPKCNLLHIMELREWPSLILCVLLCEWVRGAMCPRGDDLL